MIQLSTQMFPLPRPTRQMEITSSELHLWRISLADGIDLVDQSHKLLSDEEQLRASKFFREAQAQRFVVFHAALRNILARYCEATPEDIAYQMNEFGKPSVLPEQSPDLHFNLTHSGDLAVVAVSFGVEVGVDIEQVRTVRSFPSMMQRCLCEAERKDIAAQPSNEHFHQFLRFWTHKEAYLKSIGVGLRVPLDRLQLDLLAPEGRKVVNHFDHFPEKPHVRLMELSPCDGYVGAVATSHGESPEIKTFGWESSPHRG